MERYRFVWSFGLALGLAGCAGTNQSLVSRPPSGGGPSSPLAGNIASAPTAPVAGSPGPVPAGPGTPSADPFAASGSSPRLSARLLNGTSRLMPRIAWGGGKTVANDQLLRPQGQDAWAESTKLTNQIRAQALRSRQENLARNARASDAETSVLPVSLEVGMHSITASPRPQVSGPPPVARPATGAPTASSPSAMPASMEAPSALPDPVEPGPQIESNFQKTSAEVVEQAPAAADEPAKAAPPPRTAPPPRPSSARTPTPTPTPEPKPVAEPTPTPATPAPTTPAPEAEPIPTPTPVPTPAPTPTPAPAPLEAAPPAVVSPQAAPTAKAPSKARPQAVAPAKAAPQAAPAMPKPPSKTLPVAVAPLPSSQSPPASSPAKGLHAKLAAIKQHCGLCGLMNKLKGHGCKKAVAAAPSGQQAPPPAPAPAPASPQRVAINAGSPYPTDMSSTALFPPSYFVNPGADAAQFSRRLRHMDPAVAPVALGAPATAPTATPASAPVPPDWSPMTQKTVPPTSAKKTARVTLISRFSAWLRGDETEVDRHPLNCTCGDHPRSLPGMVAPAPPPPTVPVAPASIGGTVPSNLPQPGKLVETVAAQGLDKPSER